MPELVGHIQEIEFMHEVSEKEINAIAQPTALFNQPD